MGRAVRVFKRDGIYLVGNRCRGGMYLMAPGPEMNMLLMGALAYFADLHDIEVLAWVFLGNHFHLIVRAPKLNLSDFMRDFQSYIARKIIDMRDIDKPVFPDPYDDQELLDEESLRDKLQYVAMNPVKHGLVDHPAEWPGVSSWDSHRTGRAAEGKLVNCQKFHNFRRRKGWTDEEAREAALETHELHTTPATLHDEDGNLLAPWEAREWLTASIEARCSMLREFRRLGGVPVAGPTALLETHPLDRPDHFEPTPSTLCLTVSPGRRSRYREHRRSITEIYQKAHRAWRHGDQSVQFPPGTHPPGYSRALDPDDKMADTTPLPGTDFPEDGTIAYGFESETAA